MAVLISPLQIFLHKCDNAGIYAKQKKVCIYED